LKQTTNSRAPLALQVLAVVVLALWALFRAPGPGLAKLLGWLRR